MTASAEDFDVWRRMTQNVRPLPGRPAPPPSRRPEPAAKQEPEERSAPAPDEAASPFAPASGIDKRTARRIRRGALPIDARIDLHGMTREEAFRRLTRFIAESQAAGRRLVLVVTGKGRGADGISSGVIRREAPHWLARPPNAARVLDTAPAQPRHGGEGALYVYLRKRRP
ncbi:MAG: Smr/MutS family protein [Alphaproteobacteria bacterium]|nr:Smr/MutS family protein [Alphaproteobacteria bacterium]